MADSPDTAGILDLSTVEDTPVKVKLPDGNLYDMANPGQLSPMAYQRLSSRYRKATELQMATEATPEQVEEALDLVIDVACIVLPDAPRDTVGSMSWRSMERLIQAFFDASPTSKAGEATAESTTAS